MKPSFPRLLQWLGVAVFLVAIVGLNYDFESEAGKVMNAPMEDALSKSIRGSWPLDTGSGTSAVDSSGNGNTLSMTGSPSWVAGQVGPYALDFSGSGQYLSVADPASGILDIGDGADFSITGWFNRDTFASDHTIVAKKTDQTTNAGYVVWIDNNGGTDYLSAEISDGTDTYSAIGATDLSSTGWHQFSVVWDDSNGLFIYLDGRLDGSTTSSTASINSLANANAFRIGAESDAGVPFDGKIDNITLYGHALSASEAFRLSQITVPIQPVDTGLVGHWTFDGNDVDWSNTSTEIKDVSGQGNHGNAVGLTTASVTRGKLGQGLSFNGTSDYVATGSTVNFGGAQIITVSFWLFMSAYVNDGSPVIALGDSLFTNGAFSLRPNGDTVFNAWEILTYDGGSRLETFERPSAGEWHHFSFILDNSTVAGDMRVFVDGSEVMTTLEWADKTTSGAFRTDTLNMMTQPSVGDYLAGKLDDVRIYNRALSTTEIMSLYDMGK